MNDSKKNLLVEDDQNFGTVLKSYLEINDYKVILKQDGFQGLSAFRKEVFDLCIFDVMMPGMDGFTLAGEIRKLNQTIPFLFLTAKNLKEDVLTGFKLGADDYITKPFDTEIFIEKIKVILKRNNSQTILVDFPEEIKIGKFIYNYKIRIIQYENVVQKLSPKENELLKLLCMNMNNILSREEALMKIWKSDNYFTTRSMDVFITKLRKYLKDDVSVEISSIHGSGFRLSVG